ncbi:hypothetical protein KIN20_026214 [Parelaphostrongylus tenuis]|uniref:Uncharacterized protein n=1 Tax=Parelaphostrongylus tenuis TaxID=148309 RepID=A0AAD5N9M4_PARTN|nr:hypothetical protein KIN20_026214 [Parelaphostrongylus tenuis]
MNGKRWPHFREIEEEIMQLVGALITKDCNRNFLGDTLSVTRWLRETLSKKIRPPSDGFGRLYRRKFDLNERLWTIVSNCGL